ncbi:hypothetical protein SeMB42_g05143 [Synchytrium endobioticum]|uniref:Uncharacterized protein n=1 Tax=Synchytrium endobioticum TaxID=286115 RepID=A0A507CTA0_9FUNG|nr:hypothetical protein SeMB42_g05140 [Synchytrium endobioticum]TPX42390.1 hypothetical protein SeMB42_g05143 [Synchytrium endobioticum]
MTRNTTHVPSTSYQAHSMALSNLKSNFETLAAVFARLPDLERTLSRIHTGGCKVTDFVKALEALDALLLKMKELARFPSNFKSKRLEKLKWFHDAFDHEQALNENKLEKGYFIRRVSRQAGSVLLTSNK